MLSRILPKYQQATHLVIHHFGPSYLYPRTLTIMPCTQALLRRMVAQEALGHLSEALQDRGEAA